ncbi:ADP-ribosylation factor-like protein 9 isoform X1 [Cynoglossus semilaevis]|uniref:ARF like GTPase 9 n=1 Tax=Cynoglossus semilaevis TaxID=244447 RepID=A0A3P8UZA6_CYNSE|nr:ADP-ribosylation factor-like protein 9 isoform X1 [Cynoglossus semilaevis]
MGSLKEVGIIGATVALAGGVAYLIWNYAFTDEDTTSKSREPEEIGTRPRLREEGKDGNWTYAKSTSKQSSAKAPPPVNASEASTFTKYGSSLTQEDWERETENVERRRTKEVTTRETVVSVAAVQSFSAPRASASLDTKKTQVLVLGLDGAGKTSVLQCWATGNVEEEVEPTNGFNAVSINKEELHIEFLEIGGNEKLRQYWHKYMSKALLLVFVVDSSDPDLFPVAKEHLHELLSTDSTLPLMVLANKQDLPDSCSITDLHDALALSEIGDRKMFLIGIHTRKGELGSGIRSAWNMIEKMVCDGS